MTKGPGQPQENRVPRPNDYDLFTNPVSRLAVDVGTGPYTNGVHKVMPLDRAMHTQDGASVAALDLNGPQGQTKRGRLKIRREAFLDQHSAAEDWCNRHFSAATLSLWQVAAPLTRRYARGTVLDAGSGRGAWRNVIASSAREYHSIDIGPRGDHEPTWIGDICDMGQVPDGAYDSVVCHQVLEHVREPHRAMAEMARVLKPDGHLVISVPHLSRRHELPHDYFRFTQEGMDYLARKSGLQVEVLRTHGGCLSFLHHQASTLIPGVFLGVRGLDCLLVAANAPLSYLCMAADAVVDRGALMPLGVVMVACKGPLP